MIKYKQVTSLPDDYIQRKVDSYMLEDKATLDITTRYSVNRKATCSAIIISKEECVFVGEQIIRYIFYKCELELKVKDGDLVPVGGVIAEIKGRATKILSKERVMLNIIQRLSGIATVTRKYVEIAKPFGVKILDTRKTTPGMRLFEKYAVYVGGGTNHRFSLSTDILIKDNHIAAGGGIESVINNINAKNKYNIQVELEVDTIEQLSEGLALGVKGFLLDNMSPDEIRNCVELVRNIDDGDDIFIEASGNITLENLSDYVSTGVNAVSIGVLTHRIVSADIHLNFK